MAKYSSFVRRAANLSLVIGIAALSGCGPAPYSHSSTTERTTTTMPSPVVSTETVTTEHDAQRK